MDKIIVFSDHEIGFSILQTLIKQDKDFKIVKVFTSPDNNMRWWPSIETLGIENLEVFSNSSLYEILKTEDIDYLLLLSCKYLIEKRNLDLVKKKTINLHYSLLPALRGVYPVNNAIANNLNETGVTFHIVNESIDAGEILIQQGLSIDNNISVDKLLAKMNLLAFDLFWEFWPNRATIKPYKSSDSFDSNYYSHKKYILDSTIKSTDKMVAKDFINLVRSRTFHGKSSMVYYDEETNVKYKLSVSLNKIDE